MTLKRFSALIPVVVIAFAAFGLTYAAQPTPAPAQTPARPAASQPAQSQPAPAQPTQGRTIFDYKAELNLSDKQEQDIRNILINLNKDSRLAAARVVIMESELEDLTEKEADLEQIRKKLREISELRINLRIQDLEASRKINRVLSPEQLKKWRGIQASAR